VNQGNGAANGASGEPAIKRQRTGSGAGVTAASPAGPPSASAGGKGEAIWKAKAEDRKRKIEELEEELQAERATCTQLRTQREQVGSRKR
jgi:hypothetical protein